MAKLSRQNILAFIFLGFLLFLLGGLAWYFGPAIWGPTTPTEEGEDSGGINLFPFGDNSSPRDTGEEDNTSTEQTGDEEDPADVVQRMPRLRMVSEGPVIAATLGPADTHSGLVGPATIDTTDRTIANTIRYVELGTGHVYEASTANQDITRLSNTTIPRINEAQFVSLDRVLLRYTDDVGNYKLFSAQLAPNSSPSASTPMRLQGVFLDDGVRYLDVGPDGQIVWLQAGANGGTRVVTTTAMGEDKTQIHASPLSEWRVDWFGASDQVLLRSTPSYNSFGMAYTLDTNTGALRPYGAARKALQVLPTTDRSRALLSLKADGETRTYLWRRENNEYVELVPQTFAEKCVYAEVRDVFYCAAPVGEIAAGEPDLWYQGVSSYRDDVWVIDAQTGEAELAASPSGLSDDPIDIVDLSLSPDEQFLYFRDKDTRSLWTYQLDYIRGSLEAGEGSNLSGDAAEPAPEYGTTTDGELFFE